MTCKARTKTRLLLLLLLVPWVAVCAHSLYFNTMSDDAFITFRYARNLLEGQGLVFNPGERVQGYSDFVWVLLLALLNRAGIDFPHAAMVLGGLFAGGVVYLTFVLARRDAEGSFFFPFLAPVLLACNGSFAFWVFGGLENQLFTFLLLLGIYLSSREEENRALRVSVAIVFALLALTRPEGFLYFFAVRLYLLYRDRFSREAVVRCAAAVAVFALVMAPYKIWQFLYYGHLFTNTYYTKSQPLSVALLSRGLTIIRYYFHHYGYFTHGAILIAGLFCLRKSRTVPLIYTSILTFFLFFLAVGGDAQPYFRLFVWVHPLVAVLLSLVMKRLYERLKGAPGEEVQGWQRFFPSVSVALCSVLAAGVFLLPSFIGQEHERLIVDRQNLRNWRLTGEWLKNALPENAVIAMNNVGIVPFYSGLRTIDMLGLVDEHIAHSGKSAGPGIPGHEKFDAAYVLSRRPDIIIPGMGWLTEAPLPRYPGGGYVSDADLHQNPDLLKFYAFRSDPIADGHFLSYYLRKDILSGN